MRHRLNPRRRMCQVLDNAFSENNLDLWLQGWDQAPPIVKSCLKTWQAHNEDWTLHALSLDTMAQFIDTERIFPTVHARHLPPELLSDIIRIYLLRHYGGVWVDSTTYCLRPLNEWLPQKTESGFFAFSNPAPDRMLSTWFLSAAKGNYIVEKWSDATQQYWQERSAREHYFWFHYLFADCYRMDPFFKKMWDNTSKISADGPHYYSPYNHKLNMQATGEDRVLIDTPNAPLLKLTHKLEAPQYENNSVLDLLIARASVKRRSIALVNVHSRSAPKIIPRGVRLFAFSWDGMARSTVTEQSVTTSRSKVWSATWSAPATMFHT